MSKRNTGIAAFVIAGLAASSAGFGFSLIGWDWAWESAPMNTEFRLNPTSFPSSTGTLTQVRTALNAGLDRWGADSGSDFAFNNAGETTQTAMTQNGSMIASWTNITASGGTLAAAQTYGYNNRITECDVHFYNANAYGTNNWQAQSGGVNGSRVDLEQVATHEFGHCAGLGHSADYNAVMYDTYRSGTVANRMLGTDDQAGMIDMYGEGSGTNPGAPTGFALRIADSPVATQTFHVNITGAPANRRVYVAVGLGGEGDGPCMDAIGGQCVDIKGPVYGVGNVVTDANGTATLPITPPASAGGVTVGLQAALISGPGGAFSTLSKVDSITIATAGTSCQSGWTIDCSGQCVPANYVGDTYCDDGETFYTDNTTGFSGAADLLCHLYTFDQGDCDP